MLYTKEQWDAMSEEDQVEAMNDLWRNFCVSDAYEPGSTAKPFTVAAGLETGTLTGTKAITAEVLKTFSERRSAVTISRDTDRKRYRMPLQIHVM